jgi:hypothetical protein
VKKRRLTISDVRRVAAKHGGLVEGDGMGGYEVLAPPGRRWIDAEVQCCVLPLTEMEDDEERQWAIQSCIDMIFRGHEPYPGEPPP